MELKGRKEEQRKRSVPGIPILAGKSAYSSGGFIGSAVVGARGPMSTLRMVLTSQPALIATVTAAFTISGIGLADMNQRRLDGEPYLTFAGANIQPKTLDSPGVLPGDEDDPTSLELAAKANQGALSAGVAGGGESGEGEDGALVEDGGSEDAGGGEEGALGEDEEMKAALAAAAEATGEATGNGGADSGKFVGKVGKLSQKLASSRIGGSRMLSGGGLSSGVGRGFDELAKPGRPKGLTGSRKESLRGKTAAGGRGRTSLRGATARRLSKMNQAMGRAQSASPAAAAAVHQGAWSTSGAGESIGGAGATGAAGGGPTTAAGGAGLENGGPLGDSGSGERGEGGGSGSGEVGPAKNVTPWQKDMDMVMILLPIASLLLLAATLLAKAQQYQIAKFVAWAAAAVGAMVTLLGLKIVMLGQTMQGGMITAVGALITGLSVMAALGADEAGQANDKMLEVAKAENVSPLGDGAKVVPQADGFSTEGLKAADLRLGDGKVFAPNGDGWSQLTPKQAMPILNPSPPPPETIAV